VGEISLNRLDFGIGQGEWKDTQAVGNPVKVRVSVTAVRSDAAAQ
jgi:polyisoprenoid-binding protein YceI